MKIGGTNTIDFSKVSKIPKFVINVKAGDSKRVISLILLENNIAINLNNYTVTVAAKKSDGTDIFNDVAIVDAENGVCEVEVTEQMLALGADLPCEIVLYGSDGTVASSSNFVISRISSVRDEKSIVSSSEFTALTKALSEVKNIDSRFKEVDSQLEQKAKQIDLEVERARIDSFTNLKEGSTTGDAELVDGRVGADGFTYKNIGNAIRNQLNKKISIESGKNKFNKNKLVKGFLNADGTLTSSENYFTTEFIPVKMNEPISISQVSRKFLAYDTKQSPIVESYQDNSVTNYTYTPVQDGYIRITTQEQYFDSMMITYTPSYVSHDEYESYQELIQSDIYLNELQIENQIMPLLEKHNILYGKKWVACGDSFTEGDFTDSLTDDYIFADGLYEGENKVYPYWIGNRNNMNIVNEAKCGTTITHIDDRDDAFIDGRYKNIPTDADYITLRFGINDKGYNVPLGTIDDEINTTFYGAWNIVLRYLITSHPTAKIGIIVSNGMQTEDTFPSAIIAVARKWGIPYLNIAFDDQIPLLHRTNKDYVCQEAKDLRFNTFVVNPTTNWHPNEKAHEYESTFIENWLKSL